MDGSPKGVFVILDTTTVEKIPNGSEEKQNCFKIASATENMVLSCSNANELEAWMEALKFLNKGAAMHKQKSNYQLSDDIESINNEKLRLDSEEKAKEMELERKIEQARSAKEKGALELEKKYFIINK